MRDSRGVRTVPDERCWHGCLMDAWERGGCQCVCSRRVSEAPCPGSFPNQRKQDNFMASSSPRTFCVRPPNPNQHKQARDSQLEADTTTTVMMLWVINAFLATLREGLLFGPRRSVPCTLLFVTFSKPSGTLLFVTHGKRSQL